MTYIIAGIISGLVAGILGIGGGLLLVPFLVSQGIPINIATSTSLCAITLTSSFGSYQNYRRGQLKLLSILALAIPSIFSVSIGAVIANYIPDKILAVSFAIFLLTNIYLVKLKKKIVSSKSSQENDNKDLEKDSNSISLLVPKLLTGSLSGFLAGIFGVGGGVVLVPLQISLLGENIKDAVVNSLGVIVFTSIAGTATNLLTGNVVLPVGLMLGIGGIIGISISGKLLLKLPSQLVEYFFIGLMISLSVYILKDYI